MRRLTTFLLLFAALQTGLVLSGGAAYAQFKADSAKAEAILKSRKSVTHHSVEIAGETIEYTATAGTMIIHNDQGEPIASLGYTAYTKEDVEDLSKRPVTFAYNGGPGSSSIWLHMGALGPRRVVVNDPEVTPPAPYQLTDNHYSILNVTDVVMVDPVGTGLSRAVGEAENSDFWGIERDIMSVSRFIKTYISENNRWNSPKYLLGESYGTTRSAGVVNYLQSREGIAMNGVILVSAVLDLRTIAFGHGDNLPYIIYLPTYAAVAWYHDQLQPQPKDLEAFLEEVREFVTTDYALALMNGDELSEAKRNQIINKLSEYTGLSKEYIDRANLRVTGPEFSKQLLRGEEQVVGRLDARYLGYSIDNLAQRPFYDPQSSAISPAYTSMFLKYYHEELNFGKEMQYHISAYGLPGFDWDWSRDGSFFPTSPTTAPDLAEIMTKNPYLKVLVLNGYYDLATPFMGTEYTMNHLGIPGDLEDNIIMKYYKAGHMMYTYKPSLIKFHEDVTAFIEKTDRTE
ncbi:MAG TPA: hypothetical protein VF181_06035 [Balneolaceae bacterium]